MNFSLLGTVFFDRRWGKAVPEGEKKVKGSLSRLTSNLLKRQVRKEPEKLQSRALSKPRDGLLAAP